MISIGVNNDDDNFAAKSHWRDTALTDTSCGNLTSMSATCVTVPCGAGGVVLVATKPVVVLVAAYGTGNASCATSTSNTRDANSTGRISGTGSARGTSSMYS